MEPRRNEAMRPALGKAAGREGLSCSPPSLRLDLGELSLLIKDLTCLKAATGFGAHGGGDTLWGEPQSRREETQQMNSPPHRYRLSGDAGFLGLSEA